MESMESAYHDGIAAVLGFARGGVFSIAPPPVPFRADSKTGRSVSLPSRSRRHPLIAVVDRVGDYEVVVAHHIRCACDGKHVVFGSDEVIGLGGGDLVVSLVAGDESILVGAALVEIVAGLLNHFGILSVCSLSTPIE